jgi:hypothetical protein
MFAFAVRARLRIAIQAFLGVFTFATSLVVALAVTNTFLNALSIERHFAIRGIALRCDVAIPRYLVAEFLQIGIVAFTLALFYRFGVIGINVAIITCTLTSKRFCAIPMLRA